MVVCGENVSMFLVHNSGQPTLFPILYFPVVMNKTFPFPNSTPLVDLLQSRVPPPTLRTALL